MEVGNYSIHTRWSVSESRPAIRERADQLLGGHDCMSERRCAELMCGMHQLTRESRGRITNQGDVIAVLHREARRRIDAGVSQQSHDDRVTDAMLLELQIEIGVGETALSPMLADDDIAVARREIGMKLTTPRPLRE